MDIGGVSAELEGWQGQEAAQRGFEAVHLTAVNNESLSSLFSSCLLGGGGCKELATSSGSLSLNGIPHAPKSGLGLLFRAYRAA